MDVSLSIPTILVLQGARPDPNVPVLALLALCLCLPSWSRRGIAVPGLAPEMRAVRLLALSVLPLCPQEESLQFLLAAWNQALTLGAAWCLVQSACAATGRLLPKRSYLLAALASWALLATPLLPVFAAGSGQANYAASLPALAVASPCAFAAWVAWSGARAARQYGTPAVRANLGLLVLGAASCVLGAGALLPDLGLALHFQARFLCAALLGAAMLLARLEFQLLAAEAKQVSQSALASGLARAQRLATVGTLAAGVAHELASPMTAILGYAQLLRERASTPEDTQALTVIEQQALRCRTIAGDLTSLASARPAGREWIDPAALLERVARGFAPKARWQRVRLEWHSAPNLPHIQVDPAGLEQVLANLIANALHAAPARSLVQLDARLTESGGPSIEFEVLDQGPGLAPEVLPKLFEPFFTTRHDNGGTGLGLSVSQSIVRAHGGSILGGNRPQPATGARFLVRLPVTDCQSKTIAPYPTPALPRHAFSQRSVTTPSARLHGLT